MATRADSWPIKSHFDLIDVLQGFLYDPRRSNGKIVVMVLSAVRIVMCVFTCACDATEIQKTHVTARPGSEDVLL